MKNIYLVSNNISNKICKNIKNEKSVFVYYRKDRKALSSKEYYLEDISDHNILWRVSRSPKKSLIEFWTTLKKINKAKENISKITEGNEYRVYAPHFLWDFTLILCSHKLCTGINIVEEGGVSYKSKEALYNSEHGWKSRFNHLVNNCLAKVKSPKTLIEEVTRCYAVSHEAFPWCRNKALIEKRKVFSSKQNQFNGKVCFLSIDSIPVLGWIDKDNFLQGFRNLLEIINTIFDVVYIKMHPIYSGNKNGAQDMKKSIKEVVSDFDNVCHTEILFEDVIGSGSEITVMTLCSSVGVYAKMFDMDVYSWYSLLDKSSVRDSKKNILESFQEKYGDIKEVYNQCVE